MILTKAFFFLFILFLPSQLAIHFWPGSSLIFGIRIDQLSPTIYFSQLLLLGTLFSWIISTRPRLESKFILFVLLSLFATIVISINKEISIFKWLNYLLTGALCWFVFQNKEWASVNFKRPLIVAVIFVSLLALLQFLEQHSVGGLWYWLGERSFENFTPGIAKVTFLGHELLRPYATFPHPNVLGAFGLFTFLLLKTRAKLLSALLIIISFSEAIWIATLVVFVLQKFSIERLSKAAKGVFISSLFMPLFLAILPQTSYDISSRSALQEKAIKLVLNKPLGVGPGNFIISQVESDKLYKATTVDSKLRFQPVHNIFLLIASELGITGLILILAFVWSYLMRANRFGLLFISVVVITGSLDHYWLTLWQGLLMLGIGIGLGFGTMSKK